MNRKEMKQIMENFEEQNRLPLIELHMLISTGPALLNRDSNGRIKTIRVGGVPRVRISAQSKQRPIREAEYSDNSAHSKYLPQKIAMKLKDIGKDEDYIKGALAFLGDKGKGTGQILAFSDHDIDMIVNLITDEISDAAGFKVKKNIEQLSKDMEASAKERSVDDTTCLMGRMSTETRLLSTIEAARHASHLYSIDRWYADSDTYTAVDDLKPYTREPDFIQFLNDDVTDTGSGFMDASDIASNVFYGYTSVSTRTLLENKLREISVDDKVGINKAIEESKEIVKKYIIDYITISPTSKQSSCASTPMPLVVFISVGTRVAPLTADSVFERVVKATETKSVGEIGVERLRGFAESLVSGTFSINEYQQMYWLSELYKDSAPQCSKITDLKTALNEIVSIIGE